MLPRSLTRCAQFGIIFTFVAVVSFLFSAVFFNALMMEVGPLKTRDGGGSSLNRDDADIQAAQEEAVELETWDDERRGYWGPVPSISYSQASFADYDDPTGGSTTERTDRDHSQRERPGRQSRCGSDQLRC